jgi:hypothetical protein
MDEKLLAKAQAEEEMRQAWVREEMEKVPAEDLAALESTDALKKMLAQPESTENGVYMFGEAEIRHHRYMTARFRYLLSKSTHGVQASDDPIATLNEAVYQALAAICTDDPFNTALFWKVLDIRSQDGRVYQIFMDMVKKLGGDTSGLKDFRGLK